MLTAVGLATIFLALSYILSANIEICLSIFKTFEFWYKSYHIILCIISIYFVHRYISQYKFILVSITVPVVSGLLLMLDAIFISSVSKNVFTIVTVIVLYNFNFKILNKYKLMY